MIKTEKLIPADECCIRYNIDFAFINSLSDSGLIKLYYIEKKRFLHTAQLNDLEKYIRLYYDLQINLEGIETIHYLLKRIRTLQKENRLLQEKLHVFDL